MLSCAVINKAMAGCMESEADMYLPVQSFARTAMMFPRVMDTVRILGAQLMATVVPRTSIGWEVEGKRYILYWMSLQGPVQVKSRGLSYETAADSACLPVVGGICGAVEQYE